MFKVNKEIMHEYALSEQHILVVMGLGNGDDVLTMEH